MNFEVAMGNENSHQMEGNQIKIELGVEGCEVPTIPTVEIYILYGLTASSAHRLRHDYRQVSPTFFAKGVFGFWKGLATVGTERSLSAHHRLLTQDLRQC